MSQGSLACTSKVGLLVMFMVVKVPLLAIETQHYYDSMTMMTMIMNVEQMQ